MRNFPPHGNFFLLFQRLSVNSLAKILGSRKSVGPIYFFFQLFAYNGRISQFFIIILDWYFFCFVYSRLLSISSRMHIYRGTDISQQIFANYSIKIRLVVQN